LCSIDQIDQDYLDSAATGFVAKDNIGIKIGDQVIGLDAQKSADTSKFELGDHAMP